MLRQCEWYTVHSLSLLDANANSKREAQESESERGTRRGVGGERRSRKERPLDFSSFPPPTPKIALCAQFKFACGYNDLTNRGL